MIAALDPKKVFYMQSDPYRVRLMRKIKKFFLGLTGAAKPAAVKGKYAFYKSGNRHNIKRIYKATGHRAWRRAAGL